MISFVVASGFVPTVGDAVRSVLELNDEARVGEILVCGEDVHGGLPDDPRIRVLTDVVPGPACFGYNAALREVDGDFAVIIDGDCTLARDWLGTVQDRHAQGWDVVAGGVVAPPDDLLPTAYNHTLFHAWMGARPAGPRPCLPTMNLSLSMDVVRDVGALREDLTRTYDFDWTLRMTHAGYRLYFEPAARAIHRPIGLTVPRFWHTGFADGSSSQAVRREHAPTIEAPWLLEHPWLLAALSPGVATFTTARACARLLRAGDPRVLVTWPLVWMNRLAWALGASHGRRHGPLPVSAFQRPPDSHSE